MPSAEAILFEITGHSSKIKSAHVTMHATMIVTATQSGKALLPLTLNIVGEGDMQIGAAPKDDRMHMMLEITSFGRGSTSEIIIANGRKWMHTGNEPWHEDPNYESSTSTQFDFTSNPAAALAYLSLIKEMHWLNDETVDNIPTKHLGFTLDSAKILSAPDIVEQLEGSKGMSEGDLADSFKNAALEGEVWVGQDDQMIYKEMIHMIADLKGLQGMPEDAGADVDIAMIIKLSKFNQPVTIEPPVR